VLFTLRSLRKWADVDCSRAGGEDGSVHPLLTLAFANVAVTAPGALAPAKAPHAIGIPTAFAGLVIFFTAILALMVLVGHLRDRRRRRR